MDKHPKEMMNKELVDKLKEDGVNAKAVSGKYMYMIFCFNKDK